MLRHLLNSLLSLAPVLALAGALSFTLAPVWAQEFNVFQHYAKAVAGGSPNGLYRATCVSDVSNATTYTFTDIAIPTITNADNVLLLVGFASEDSAIDFAINSATADGVALAEMVDSDSGTSNTLTVGFYGSTTTTFTNAALVTISVTFSEAITGATACVWAIVGAASATEDNTEHQGSSNSSSLSLEMGTTVSPGFALGICAAAGAASTTWTVLTEREDTGNAEFDYSTADAATTGSTMSITCDWSGTAESIGATIAVH